MIVYCATGNAGKLREFRAAGSNRVIIHPLPGLAGIAPPEETGSTFTENASQKAAYYSRYADGYLFADDSGLEVEALGNAPGVYSARYAGRGASDEANNGLLLERMRGVNNRSARFVCIIALARGGEVIRTFEGVAQGQLLEGPRGMSGFGYDPLFYYPPANRTFAELDGDGKLSVSHRGATLRALVGFLEGLAGEQPG